MIPHIHMLVNIGPGTSRDISAHIDIGMHRNVLMHIQVDIAVVSITVIGIAIEIVIADITATPVDRPVVRLNRPLDRSGPDFLRPGRRCLPGCGIKSWPGWGYLLRSRTESRPGWSASARMIKSLRQAELRKRPRQYQEKGGMDKTVIIK
jgi:hypothetical protein